MKKPIDYSVGVGKEIAEFVKHQLCDFGPYGLQLIISREKAPFKRTRFKVEIFTENRKSEQVHKVGEYTIEEAAILHITDIAEAFRFDFK